MTNFDFSGYVFKYNTRIMDNNNGYFIISEDAFEDSKNAKITVPLLKETCDGNIIIGSADLLYYGNGVYALCKFNKEAKSIEQHFKTHIKDYALGFTLTNVLKTCTGHGHSIIDKAVFSWVILNPNKGGDKNYGQIDMFSTKYLEYFVEGVKVNEEN